MYSEKMHAEITQNINNKNACLLFYLFILEVVFAIGKEI